MAAYDLYGFLSPDINEAKKILEAALDIEFVAHDSSYQGGGYFCYGNTAKEHFILKRNVDFFDDEPAEMSFPEYPILFYINDTTHSEQLKVTIEQNAKNFILVRHEDL